MRVAIQHCMTEWSYSSGRPYHDPFDEVEVDVLFTNPKGEEKRVPAFWAGGQTWRVRYASPVVGTHRYRSVCSDEKNPDLHGQEGTLQVVPGEWDLASKHTGETIRTLAPRHVMGAHAVGGGVSSPWFRSTGPGETVVGTISLVAI